MSDIILLIYFIMALLKNKRKERKMKKKFLIAAVLVLALTLTGTVMASAAQDNDECLTRGEFAALLVKASGMKSDLSPVELLLEKDIIRGYLDGGLHLDSGITRAEAVTLTARVLGLSDSVVYLTDGKKYIDPGHWAYNFYSWFGFLGLTEGNPQDVLSKTQGEAFLEGVFSTDPDVVILLEDSRKSTADIETLSSTASTVLKMIPRPGMEGLEGMTDASFEMNISQEMVLPNKIHQISTALIEVPEQGIQEFTSEMYLVDGKIYQSTPDMETGEQIWHLYPEGLMPDLEKLIEQQMQTDVIPPGLEDYIYYKLLGEEEINGEKVYKIAQYGRIDDFGEFLEVVMGQVGNMPEMEQLISMSVSMIESMSLWGVEYVGAEDKLTKSADIAFVITYAPELAGMPNPLEAIQFQIKMKDYKYNEEIVIELPEEALNAVPLELPEGLFELE